MYFGRYDNWAKDNNVGTLETCEGHELFTAFPPPLFFKAFREEMSEISKQLITANPTFAKEIESEKIAENKYANTEGSVVSWYCQEWERRTLEVIYDVLKNEKLIKKENVVLCFDGLMILLTELFDTEEKQQIILRKCEGEVFTRLKLNINLKVKAFDEPIDDELLNFEIPEVSEVDNDDDSEEEEETVGIAKEMVDFYNEHFGKDGFFDRVRLGIAELVNKLSPKHFIYHFKEWYGWSTTKNKWQKSKIPLNRSIMYDIRDYLKDALRRFKTNKKEFKGAIGDKFKLLEDGIQSVIKKSLCNPLEVDFIVKAAENIMEDDDVQFDMNENLFGCKNGVYDILNDEFRNYRFDDYVTMSCGFDFEDLRTAKGDTDSSPCSPECRSGDSIMKRELTEDDARKFNDIHAILDQVFPDKEVQKLVLIIFASGVSGKCIEKFVLFNGAGGNAKGLLDEFVASGLGDYFHEASVTLLTHKTTTGSSPNPEKANIDKKRCVLFKEPAEHAKLLNSEIKGLTGGGKLPGARPLYSKKTDADLHNTTIMECNKRPKLLETPNNADIRRIIDIHFGSSFITEKSEVDEKNHIYLQNPLLKETEWKVNHRVYLLNILFEMLQELKKQNYIIDDFIPQCVKDRSNEYLQGCYDIHQIYVDAYQLQLFTDDEGNSVNFESSTILKNDLTFVSLIAVAKTIKQSASFHELPKAKQREMTNDVIYEFFKTNPAYKKYHVENHLHLVGDIMKKSRNVLLGWSIKPVVENEEE